MNLSPQELVYVNEFKEFHSLSLKTQSRFRLDWADRYPCLNEKTQMTDFDRHYVYHTAWAARVLADLNPPEHIDISSSLYFSSIVSAFIPCRFYDYRPPALQLSQLQVARVDVHSLEFASDSIESLSCMHVVEHIGLGRYGDRIDYDGDLKAVRELKRVVKKGGSLLFVVPIGKALIQFNAHRVYDYAQIINLFSGFSLKQYALIPDHAEAGGLIIGASESLTNAQSYGCGCFWFQKL